MPNLHRNKSQVFAPVAWSGSVVIWLANLTTNILTCLSPLSLAEHFFFASRKKDSPLWLPELWVIFLLFLEGIMLVVWPNRWFAVYVLLDVFGATLRDMVTNPQYHSDRIGRYIQVRDPLRWLLMALLNLGQVILSFAILFLSYGEQFIPPIRQPLAALYQSTLTFTTLGYGDIRPACGTGRLVVCIELAFFLVLIVTKLPVAVSVIRVKGTKEN